jgi:transcriptional regulator with XRE-family HTH domain
MPVNIRIRFGRAIRRIREAQEINQEKAAERCGLHRTYYGRIERGVRNVSLVNFEKIPKGLKMVLPELFSPALMSSFGLRAKVHQTFGGCQNVPKA